MNELHTLVPLLISTALIILHLPFDDREIFQWVKITITRFETLNKEKKSDVKSAQSNAALLMPIFQLLGKYSLS